MENLQGSDIVAKLKHVIAENRSLVARLEEYKSIVAARDEEIEILHTMVSEANAMRSNMDNELSELESLKAYMGQIKSVTSTAFSGDAYFGQNGNGGTDSQARELKEMQARLQMQVEEMEIEMRELSNRNILLQQQNSRIGELESLLEITERERDEYKEAAGRK